MPWKNPNKLTFTEKIEELIKKFKWRALFYERKNKEVSSDGLQSGLKSTKCLLQVKVLVAFKEDLVKLVNMIKFHKTHSEFKT